METHYILDVMVNCVVILSAVCIHKNWQLKLEIIGFFVCNHEMWVYLSI